MAFILNLYTIIAQLNKVMLLWHINEKIAIVGKRIYSPLPLHPPFK
ncbi:conserved protein of unknown function [Limnospira indica PCC 8005]|uniref:Uncharacterized protein n=1 Tax=Limnospira indica PCC 8005 TaxID=376219 RepID=A0A9P1KGD8_9CYAN|nr:conserved protein of unknown function [Limnospira indica PCC 8005]